MENLKYIKDVMGLEKVIAGLKSSTQEEFKRIEFLESQKAKKEELIDQQKSSINLIKSSTNDTEKQLFEVEKKLEQAKSQLDHAASQTQVNVLEANISELESESNTFQDTILTGLENIEESQKQIDKAQEFVRGLDETINEIQEEVSLIQKSNSEKIHKLEMQIEGLLSEVPEIAQNLYRKAKQKHPHDAATFLVGTSCGSCKLTYAQAECDRFNNGSDMILCKGCGRLLLPSNLRTL